ncbi:MAG: type II toxin-antitoxin system PemK/MazF family toxin [Desulfuromonadia bacterium]
MYKRGGIYTINLPHRDSEQREPWPCLVISNNIANEYSPVVTIIPLSFQSLDVIYDFETFLPPPESGLDRPAKVSSHILITIDKSQVIGERLGFLSRRVMEQVENALRIQLGLADTPLNKE